MDTCDPEFEDEDDEFEEENDDDIPPGFNMNEWLADYEAIKIAHALEQSSKDDPSDSEIESEVDNPDPPTPFVSMLLPQWAPWRGHLADLQ